MAGSPIEEIIGHIQAGNNFLLSGGAGSGKTYTLIESIDHIYQTNINANVACITFTNVAADEITERAPYNNLWVSTIHEFLWAEINSFQKNLKTVLVDLLKSEEIRLQNSSELVLEELEPNYYHDKEITYKEFKVIDKGIISHNEVLKLANSMFARFKLLRKMLCDKYNYILIDEYQDTEEQVIQIFLDYMRDEMEGKLVIGLFGDSMQSIYEKGIGDLQGYIEQGLVKEIIKEDNYRCSISTIDLLNKIRVDISQKPSENNKAGSIKFIYSNNDNVQLNDIKGTEYFSGWDFADEKETKELYLTHKLIARQRGFIDLLSAYPNSDRLMGDYKDKLAKHLYKMEDLLYAYEKSDYNEVLKLTDLKVKSHNDKVDLKKKIENILQLNESSIDEIIKINNELGLIIIDDDLKEYFVEKEEQYKNIRGISYSQFRNLYAYEQGFSPYSTQHGVKGTEFNNVFVILDNGNWNMYNFKSLFENQGNPKVIERTRKVFYVCCSRTKDNLIVYFNQPTNAVISQAQAWFGQANVHQV